MEVTVPASHSATEAVADIFAELGSGGVVLEDPRELNYYIKSGLWDYTDLAEAEDQGITVVKA
jgi:ribosomal protein L11 methyltransferase